MPTVSGSITGCGMGHISSLNFNSKKTTQDFIAALERVLRDTAKAKNKKYRMYTYTLAQTQLLPDNMNIMKTNDDNRGWFYIHAHPFFVKAFRPKKILEWENSIHSYNKNVMFSFKLTDEGLAKLKKLLKEHNIL